MIYTTWGKFLILRLKIVAFQTVIVQWKEITNQKRNNDDSSNCDNNENSLSARYIQKIRLLCSFVFFPIAIQFNSNMFTILLR